MKNRYKLAAALSLAASLTALAEVKLNDNFSVSGYIEGSYQSFSPDPGPSSDSFNIDSSLLLFTGTFKPVTATVSFFYLPNAPTETTVLDAYVTYDAGNGFSVTGGKFLSYLGYESFFTVNNPEISFANGDFLGAIPGYHDGVRLDFSNSDIGWGVALVDSVYSGPYYLKGDGELKKNAGYEGYFAYKGITGLTLWAGLAYDAEGNLQTHDITTFDFWAQYQVTKAVSVAGEYAHKDGGTGNTGDNWLALVTFAATDKISLAGRVSGEKLDDGGPGFTKLTFAPSYAVTDKLTVRAEVSYYDYTKFTKDSATYFGVQAFIKF